MKRLDELGVSPAPWRIGEDEYIIRDKGYLLVAETATISAARLIAAAPDLYEALREAVVEHSCYDCDGYNREHEGMCCKADGECFVQRWRKALEKAGGGE